MLFRGPAGLRHQLGVSQAMDQTTEEILLTVRAALDLGSEDPERAELLLRSALRHAKALGQKSVTLHLLLAELLWRLRKNRQALRQVSEVLQLDPFNLVAVNLHQILGRRARRRPAPGS
jgi:hypothetical protein